MDGYGGGGIHNGRDTHSNGTTHSGADGYSLHVDALSVGYDGQAVLRDLSFTLRAGEILALIGPNGAGKSTLLRTLIRQLEPLCGVACLNGRDMAALRGEEIARSLSVVMTDRMDGELLTAEDVVRSGRYPYTGRLGILSAHDRAVVEEAMEQTGVTGLRNRYFRQLSDGQRQRVLLARAVCQEPEILVMDEPTSFLDIRCQMELLSLLRDLVSRRGLAVILSLHELGFARCIADRLLCVRGGVADRTGPPEILTPAYIEHLYDLPPGSYARLSQWEPLGDNTQTGSGTQKSSGEPPKNRQDEPRYSFYQNRACEMFPCHKGISPAEFNCLFCYCPLYALGERCGGAFAYTEKGIKDCTNCTFPHVREHYRAVLARFPELAALAAWKEQTPEQGEEASGREV